MPNNEGNHPVCCSFCGKTQEEVYRLLAGPGVYICDECIVLCDKILHEGDHQIQHKPVQKQDEPARLPTPKEIKTKLDEYVSGQDSAKVSLSVAVYNHYKRIFYHAPEDPDIGKSNVLLLGPTGVGKTALAQTLARILDVPFAITDATTLTEAGYVGEDVENILLRLIQAADGDIEKAQRGIIYIDEIDKISRRSENPSITRDVSGEGVQQALLKILEGTVANVPPNGGRKHPQMDCLQIDTTNILFILGGAFDGIEKIIEKRMSSGSVGFGGEIVSKTDMTREKLLASSVPQDLIRYGLIPELVGRMPVITTLQPLDAEALVRILKEPKNSILKQYVYLFELDGVRLTVDDDALRAMAEKTLERKTGARGLRAVMEELLTPWMFEVPSDHAIEEIIFHESCVTEGADPELVRNPNRKPAKIRVPSTRKNAHRKISV